MINVQTKNEWLVKIAELLDISPSQYDEAESRYLAVGQFLSACPKISPHKPIIYPQGSFRLGTVVKPILEGEDFDVDLVCQLTDPKQIFSPKELKNLIGNRLKEPQYINQLQKEKRRCWELKYHDRSNFHLDIIPAKPDEDSKKILQEYFSLEPDLSNTAISITDNLRSDYVSYSADWPKGNPKAYAVWFENRMSSILQEAKRSYAQRNNVKIENVPTFKVKTPLQRSIQILKRHRDVQFRNDEDKPISIIISTLSAQSYNNESNLFIALENIVFNMEKHIKKDADGNDVVLNPVDPRENFADKWEDYPQRRENFYDWLEKVKLDLTLLKSKNSVQEIETLLGKSLDNKVVTRAKQELSLRDYQTSVGLEYFNTRELVPNRAPNEDFIEEKHEIKLDNSVVFKIDCKVTQDGFRTALLKKLPILKKHKSLEFFVDRISNIQEPYQLKWKVRNCGPASVGRERGEILLDYGQRKRKENSSFYGDHFVECYLIKNDVCIAMDRIDVPISLN